MTHHLKPILVAALTSTAILATSCASQGRPKSKMFMSTTTTQPIQQMTYSKDGIKLGSPKQQSSVMILGTDNSGSSKQMNQE